MHFFETDGSLKLPPVALRISGPVVYEGGFHSRDLARSVASFLAFSGVTCRCLKILGIVSRSLSRQERAGAREPQFYAGLIISSKTARRNPRRSDDAADNS